MWLDEGNLSHFVCRLADELNLAVPLHHLLINKLVPSDGSTDSLRRGKAPLLSDGLERICNLIAQVDAQTDCHSISLLPIVGVPEVLLMCAAGSPSSSRTGRSCEAWDGRPVWVVTPV